MKSNSKMHIIASKNAGQFKMLKSPQPILLASMAAPTARNGSAIARARKSKVFKIVIEKLVSHRERTEYSGIFFGEIRSKSANSTKRLKKVISLSVASCSITRSYYQ